MINITSTFLDFNEKNLKKTLSMYATGVAVVTTTFNNKPIGMTINSFSSVSLNPAMVLWNIRNKSKLYKIFINSKIWGINILNENQKDLALKFCSKTPNKFNNIDWELSDNQTPIIIDTLGFIECKTKKLILAGDHTILLGDVNKIKHNERNALAFFNSEFITV